jgi:uncharacterized membrane protein YhiD involved in acid resistance
MGNWIIPPPVSILSMTLNLVLGLVLSLLVAWYYSHYGQSFANRNKFALLLPALTLTTAIVITIVKSSLALSLGLVGALSIVRFRTAIKDPEELIFLFIAITIGLGIGAEQNVPTVIGVILLLAYMGVKVLISQSYKGSNLYLNIFIEQPDKPHLDEIQNCLSKHVKNIDFRRLDSRDGLMQLTFLIDIDDTHTLNDLVEDLHRQFSITEISFLKQEA